MKLFEISRTRPRAILWFERLGATGVALDFLHLVMLIPRRAAVDGVPLAIAFTLLVPLLLLWLILLASRRGSNLARWLVAILVALAAFAAFQMGTSGWWTDPAILIGALALLFEIAAVVSAVLPAAGKWFERGSGPANA